VSARDARISPTAHYTGYVWYRNGLSHRALATSEGRALYTGLRPFNAATQRIGAPTLEGFLLARHLAIDEVLNDAIRSDRIGQVVEVAAGLSPRGWDFSRRYPGQLTYIEADLAPMAARKRDLLQRGGLLKPGHRVVAIDALADDGPESLAALADTLDPTKGLAIVTEGLLNYFPRDAVTGMWARFARTLARFPGGLYLSDLHLRVDNRGVMVDAFSGLLSTFVRGRVHLHFGAAEDAQAALRGAGFDQADLIAPKARASRGRAADPAGAAAVRVVVAETFKAQSRRG
jgi:O-methyltransferase involved in polyketide biosynthesis